MTKHISGSQAAAVRQEPGNFFCPAEWWCRSTLQYFL